MSSLKYCTILLGCTGVLVGTQSPAQVRSRPPLVNWEIGDSWTVKTWYSKVVRRANPGESLTRIRKAKEVLVSFSVSGMEEIEDQPCYTIKVVYPREATGFQRRYTLWFRAETMGLAQVTDESIGTKGSVKHSAHRFPMDAEGPVFVPFGYASAVPFNFPDLNSGDSEETDRNNYTVRQVVTGRAGKTADGRTCDEREFVLTRSKEGTDHEEKTVLTWVEGEPWWRRAVKYKNGKIVGEAELVEFTTDGKRRVVKPKQDEE